MYIHIHTHNISQQCNLLSNLAIYTSKIRTIRCMTAQNITDAAETTKP